MSLALTILIIAVLIVGLLSLLTLTEGKDNERKD